MMVVRWALPVTVLTFIPKCPACVAAYALLFTGISISVSAGNAVRWTVIALCTAVLARLVLRAARRALLA